MNVEVVYATPEEQTVIELVLDAQATVSDAISASGLLKRYPRIEVGVTPVGIYGEKVHHDTVLADGDRVEIYRPLEVDPMEARRLRARSQSSKPDTGKPNSGKQRQDKQSRSGQGSSKERYE